MVFESTARSTRKLETALEAAWSEELGFTSTTIVRSRPEVRRLVDSDPFDGADLDTKGLQVTFLKDAPAEHLPIPFRSDDDGFTIVAMDDAAICTAVDLERAGTPDLMAWLERRFGQGMTTRSWKSVNRILVALG